jgi:homoprotocatechuate degradation regulator HpaR
MKDFAQSLPMMLLKGREATMQRFRPMLHSAGITEQQWRVLRILEHDGSLEISELARRCLIMMPSISRTLQNMESSGWVSRNSMKDDKRKSEISITATGRELVARVVVESDRIYEQIEERFDTEKRTALNELLDDLHSSLTESSQ